MILFRVFHNYKWIFTYFIYQVIYVNSTLGQSMTDKFDEFSEKLGQCNWYIYPIGIKRMYGTFLLNAQQETYLQGYGNLVCSHETMKKVK